MNHYIKQNHLKNTFLVLKSTKIDSGCVLLELFGIMSIPVFQNWLQNHTILGETNNKETAWYSNHPFPGTFWC